MRLNAAGLWLLLGMSCSCMVWADEDTAPSMAFLEFLGEWETDEGEWIDPQILESMEAETPADEVPDND